jgi:hypothetical protein
MNFPQLVTAAAPLLEAAGLKDLTIEARYSTTGGKSFSAHAFAGRKAVPLVCITAPASTKRELQARVTDALTERNPFVNCGRL